jgi:hypothetical protein
MGTIEIEIRRWNIRRRRRITYHSNYSPPCLSEIYFDTFQETKKKAGIFLKKRYIKELTEEPDRLFKYLKNNVGFAPPEEITITFKEAKILRIKCKSQHQQLSYKKKLYS